MRRARDWLLAGALAGAAGCGGQPPAPVAPTPGGAADGGKLLARARDLEREVRDLRAIVERLERELRGRDATLRVARARLQDRERELAALRAAPPAAGAAGAADPVDGHGESAPDYVRRLLDEIAADPATALEDDVDWPGFVATMLADDAGGAGGTPALEPAAAVAALAALPEAEREAALAGARALLNDLMGGPEGLAALKPRVGQHYRLGDTVRVELLADGPEGAEQRFVLSVARAHDRWRVVGLSRD